MIIGLVGFAGSGKGTVSDVIVHEYNFTKLSFADAVKDATSAIFGWPRHLLEGVTDDSRRFRERRDDFWSERLGYEVTPRYMLQLMGTEAGRNVFHENIWVYVLENKIRYKQEWEFEDNFVIPDVRFPNEVEAIRNMGGFIVRVARGKEPEWFDVAYKANLENNFDLMKEYNVHYSEWAWIGQRFDYLISNNGTLDMLNADVRHLIRVFTGPTKDDILFNSDK